MQKQAMQKHLIPVILLISLGNWFSIAHALPKNIMLNQDFCDAKKIACLRGSLYFDENSQQISFKGRVSKSTQPGTFILKLIGESDSGKSYKLELKHPLKGQYSEIVRISKSFDKRSDMPQRITWRVDKVEYKVSGN